MTWSLRLGGHASWLEKVSKEQGKQFAALVGAPTLTLYEDFYFQAFQDLSGSRASNGFGMLPLMISELSAYAELCGVSIGEERMEFVRYLRVLDGVYLKHHNQKDSVAHG